MNSGHGVLLSDVLNDVRHADLMQCFQICIYTDKDGRIA